MAGRLERVGFIGLGNIGGPMALVQIVGGTSFVTVDFSQALSCNWESLHCVLNAGQVGICGRNDLFGAVSGCP